MDTKVIDELLTLKSDLEDPVLWAAVRRNIAGPVMDEETEEEKKEREEREQKEKDDAEAEAQRKKDEEDEKNDDFVRMPKGEAARLRKEAADAAKEKREREKKDKAEREKQQAQQGQFEEMAAEAKKERDEAVEAKEKAEKALADFKSEIGIEKVAKRLNFKDPGDAHLFLTAEERAMDENGIERGLKRVLREKSYLKSDRPDTGGGHGGGGGGSGNKDLFTMEEIGKLSQKEQIQYKDKVSKSLEAIGASSS